jgi:hypothetical protein
MYQTPSVTKTARLQICLSACAEVTVMTIRPRGFLPA